MNKIYFQNQIIMVLLNLHRYTFQAFELGFDGSFDGFMMSASQSLYERKQERKWQTTWGGFSAFAVKRSQKLWLFQNHTLSSTSFLKSLFETITKHQSLATKETLNFKKMIEVFIKSNAKHTLYNKDSAQNLYRLHRIARITKSI